MNNFLLSTASQQEIQGLDSKIHETVDTINQLKTNREFFLSFAKDPQQFIHKWIVSQTRDLKVTWLAKSIKLKCNWFFFQHRQWLTWWEIRRKNVDRTSFISLGLKRLFVVISTLKYSRSVLSWNRLWVFEIISPYHMLIKQYYITYSCGGFDFFGVSKNTVLQLT